MRTAPGHTRAPAFRTEGACPEPAPPSSAPDAAAFARNGFLVVAGLAPRDICAVMRSAALDALEPLTGPAEFEADVGYPGAPAPGSPGDRTPRRLLHAVSRHRAFRDWATGTAVAGILTRLMRRAPVLLSQSHHNCVMTKHPGYSSATHWHQDVRYWSFERQDLVSVWLALGRETEANGALRVIPGSHRLTFERSRLDEDLFLRPDVAANAALIERAETVRLEPGDALFFSGRLFHAAGRNGTDAVKLSVVTTYHAADNRPLPGTRSGRYPSLPLAAPGR